MIKKFLPVFFLLPALSILFFLQFFAWGWNLNIVVHDVKIENILKSWPFVGVENFTKVFQNPITYDSLKATGIFAISCVLIQIVVGTAIAYFLYRMSKRWERIFRPIIILPWLSSVLFVGFSWSIMFNKDLGLINLVLSGLGLGRIDWLGDPGYAMFSIITANNWWGLPFTILFIGSALTTINPQILEAAKIDGAGDWQIFRYVVIPLLKPFLLINLILITSWTLNMFGLILVMTDGGPLHSTRVFPLHSYKQAFDMGNFSSGATIALLLLLINFGFVYGYIKLSGGVKSILRG